MNGFEEFKEILPFLIPLILINLALVVIAFRDLIKRKRVRGGNKVLWGILIIALEFVGPIIYLFWGREED